MELKWNTNTEYPLEDCKCLVHDEGWDDYKILNWNTTYKCWDDESGDDYYCDTERIDKWVSLALDEIVYKLNYNND